MKNINFLNQAIIAHRGLHDDKVPENSIKAFKLAIKNKNIIELDVHLTKDNEIVVFHDDDLQRMLDISGHIKDFTYEELKNKFLKDTKNTIPTFSQVLKEVNCKVPLIIELKYDQRVGRLESQIVKLLDDYKGNFCVKSFSPLSIMWFRIFRPNYIRGYLISNKNKTLKQKILKSKLIIKLCNPDFISCNCKLYNTKLIKYFKNKIPVIAWTIRNKEEYFKYKDKFDNLICENIASFED